MAITRLGGANAISGTLPAANINNTSISSVTSLPAADGSSLTGISSGLNFIKSVTPSGSSSTVSVTSIFSSSYRNYRIVLAGLSIATQNSDMVYRFLTGTDTDYSSTNYFWAIGTSNRNNSSNNEKNGSDSRGRFISNTSNDDDTISGNLIIYNPAQSTKTTVTSSFVDRYEGATVAHSHGGCWVNASDALQE